MVATDPRGCAAAWCAIAAVLAWAPPAAFAQLLAAGDPAPDRVELWARAERAGDYRLELATDAAFTRPVAQFKVRATDAGGLTLRATATDLKPETRYHYRLVTASGTVLPARAAVMTAPAPDARRSAKFLFGADLGGQGYGRLRAGNPSGRTGWPIFVAMQAERADLFIALGDMLYSDRALKAEALDADFPSGNDFQIPKPGPGYVRTLADFHRDWLYHREDEHYDRFLRGTPLMATWDDHEIVNDSGGPELTRGPSDAEFARDPRLRQADPARPREANPGGGKGERRTVFYNPELYAAGREAMFAWNPIAALPDPARQYRERLYRSLRWGQRVEILLLDTRSYRDPRYRIDSDTAPKTMRGAAQKEWLKERLKRSDATWKLVVSSVPLAIAGRGERDAEGHVYRDSWLPAARGNPYGYGRELRELVQFLRAEKIVNVVFLTGDQHFTNLIAYDPAGDGTPAFHEANVGPLRSGPSSGKQALDRSLHPTRLYTDAGKAEHTYGVVDVDGDTGRLTIRFRDVDGKDRPGAKLELQPR